MYSTKDTPKSNRLCSPLPPYAHTHTNKSNLNKEINSNSILDRQNIINRHVIWRSDHSRLLLGDANDKIIRLRIYAIAHGDSWGFNVERS